MKAVICTSNGIRHKFFANSITSVIDETLIISESNTNDANQLTTNDDSSIIDPKTQKLFDWNMEKSS